MNIVELNPELCVRWDLADRSKFEFGNIDALAKDIKLNGQIEPAIVRAINQDKYKFEIITGSRRWKACLENNLLLKAIVKEINDSEAIHHQLKENDKEPISDYSIGMHLSKAINAKKTSILEIARLMGYSRRKVENLLVFSKIPHSIWDMVGNMSKVSSRAADMIYRLSNKGDEYIEALIDIAEEISKGIGAKKIEGLVEKIVCGGSGEIDFRKEIKTTSGKIIGFWSKTGIIFDKGVDIDQSKIEDSLVKLFSDVG